MLASAKTRSVTPTGAGRATSAVPATPTRTNGTRNRRFPCASASDPRNGAATATAAIERPKTTENFSFPRGERVAMSSGK